MYFVMIIVSILSQNIYLFFKFVDAFTIKNFMSQDFKKWTMEELEMTLKNNK